MNLVRSRWLAEREQQQQHHQLQKQKRNSSLAALRSQNPARKVNISFRRWAWPEIWRPPRGRLFVALWSNFVAADESGPGSSKLNWPLFFASCCPCCGLNQTSAARILEKRASCCCCCFQLNLATRGQPGGRRTIRVCKWLSSGVTVLPRRKPPASYK